MQLATAHDMSWTKGSVENRIILTERRQHIAAMHPGPNYSTKLLYKLWNTHWKHAPNTAR